MLTSKESLIDGMENLRKIDNEIPDSNAISKSCRVISKKYTFPSKVNGLPINWLSGKELPIHIREGHLRRANSDGYHE
jgi:hypothetical protein